MTTPTTTTAFYIHANGDPAAVLESGADTLPTDLQPPQVLLKILAAPVNPSDLYGVLGIYPVPLASATTAIGSKTEDVRIPGFKGVAEVARVGSDVHGIEVGDWVIPFRSGFGTWRAHAVVDDTNVFVVRKKGELELALEDAAALYINLPTAYRLLKNFVVLEKGDWSSRQFARRQDFDAAKQSLLDLGATAVLRDQTDDLAEYVKENVDPKCGVRLALDSVGGASLAPIVKALGDKGSAVLYSMVSGDPAPAIPVGDVIFRELKLFGFWVAQWDRDANIADKQAVNNELVALLHAGKIKSPAVEQVVVPSDGRAVNKDAVQRVASGLAGYRGKKDLIVFQH
ncbi:hypothetical protein AMAG_08045 [Allomyces macrogynus ATCC 38327]|uniref:enoyl-[acyl-carrier-protein] reductase n=1 Tax=Allomyces macrogynus (strain ATCC 38327) TaxID=578462 RepID=A0A0L0SK74_ALLM3|nr:hypothetical protein AMAG_08045 [Allomyces macrogynus ATCC 38327]|eukprot:KNE62868.1 hypothetical protein AMAG_08045 [Allomyces macrogynus ATCC 38327]